MAFKFSLATVMRLREIAEEREERLLQQIMQQIVQARQTLVDLATRRESLLRQREDMLMQKTSAAELLLLQGQLRSVDDLQESGKKQVADLESLRLKQMQVYEEAHRGRELLAGMREKSLMQFRRTQLRQEQDLMDDIFAARRGLR